MVGQKIKKAIDKSEYSPEQVAAYAEMSVTNLYKIYKRNSIESRYLIKIAEFLNLPYSYFLDDDAEMNGNYQSGIGNAGGNIHKQKIMPSEGKDTASPSSNINLAKIQHELDLCRAKQESLEKEVALKDEIIELLKGRK